MQQKRFLICDTETTGLGSRAIVFDFAYVIATRTKILCERQFLVRETLTNPRIMLSALFNKEWRAMFGGKLFRHYIPGLDDNTLALHNWRDILNQMREDILTYNVSVFCAYNLVFDLGALNKTHYLITERKAELNFSRLDLLCLWEFACVTILNSQLYHDVCAKLGEDKGFLTPVGNVRTTAEKTYAYLTGNYDFIESHTALKDAQIETEILQRLLARKKTIPYNILDHMPWQKAQRIRGRLLDNPSNRRH